MESHQWGDTSWLLDVQTVTTTVLTTTGGTLWNAANRCMQYLEAAAVQVGLDRPGIRVLELGAGCGTLGLTVARNVPQAAEVCLTEQAFGGALQHLQRNIAANMHLPNMGSVTCCACDWTHFNDAAVLQAAAAAAAVVQFEDTVTTTCSGSIQQHKQEEQQQQQQQQQPPADVSEGQPGSSVSRQELLDLNKLVTTSWDIIIGSDLIYNKAGAWALPRVLATLMKPPQDQHQPTQWQLQQQQQPEQLLVSGSCQPSITCGNSTGGVQQQGRCCSKSRLLAGRQRSQPCGPVMYYAHTKHRYDTMDVLLLERLEAEGLTVEEVTESGSELPPPSPPPFSSLFPDMRCAVFKVYRAS